MVCLSGDETPAPISVKNPQSGAIVDRWIQDGIDIQQEAMSTGAGAGAEIVWAVKKGQEGAQGRRAGGVKGSPDASYKRNRNMTFDRRRVGKLSGGHCHCQMGG
jgi:hypothetical protein